MSDERYLLPGDVLMQDLLQPGTSAIFVPGGTILTAEVIMKIRQAGLEDQALDCVADKKKALHAGISLRRCDPRAVMTATELAQMRAERLVESAVGLRTVLYLLLGACTVFAVVSQSAAFMFLMGVIYLGLVFAYLTLAAITEGHKRRIIQLKLMERREAEQKRRFLARVTQGDPEAVAEVIMDGVVGKELVLSIEIEPGYIVLHVIMRDTIEVARRAGVELVPRPATAKDRAHVRSRRLATTSDIAQILESSAEILAGIFTFSPTTYMVALSVFDPYEDTLSRSHYLGCIASGVVDRVYFEEMAREGGPAIQLGRSGLLKMEYERNGPFQEAEEAVVTPEMALELEF